MEHLNWTGFYFEYYSEKLLKYYLKKCPTLFHLCYDPIGTHKRARAAIGFCLGFFLAICFYAIIIADLQFDTYTSLALGAMITMMMSLGCAFSIQIRCVSLLTVPAFFGRAGRGFLKALVLGYVITGPIFNLTFNGKEVVRTFVCSTGLTYNLTKTRVDLMFKPFQKAIMEMKADAAEIKNTLASVNDLISPIIEEIEGEKEMKRLKEESDSVDESMGDTKSSEELEQKVSLEKANAKSEGEVYEANYRAKIQARCEEQLNRGSNKCRDMFANAYDKCYNSVTWIAAWLLCWPMKLTFVCNIVQALGGQSICNPEGKVDTGIGEGYVSLKATQKEISASLQNVKLQYKVVEMPVILDTYTADDVAKAIVHEFQVRKNLIDMVIMFIKRCLSFIFIRIIFDAQNYHDNYLTDIEYDNIYISLYFRKIDLRRKLRGSMSILPLKKVETMKFVDPYGLKQSKIERKNLIGQTMKLILELLTVSSFVLLDMLFYETLLLIRKHARIDYSQICLTINDFPTKAGHHDVTLEIHGTGVIASLLRSVVRGFNIKRRVKTMVSNEACLPRPSKLSNYILSKIYGTYVALWLMILLTAYTQRFRRIICGFFYRRREKRRILYLYNETLRRRIGFFRFMRTKVIALTRSRNLELEQNIWLMLKTRWPKYFSWLTMFAFARRKCLICEEIEPRRKSDYVECATAGCPAVHCTDCWRDIGQMCLACFDFSESEVDDYDAEFREQI